MDIENRVKGWAGNNVRSDIEPTDVPDLILNCIKDLNLKEADQWISVCNPPSDDTKCVVADISEFNGEVVYYAAAWFVHGSFHVEDDGLKAENYDGGAQISFDLDITHYKII